MKQFLKSVPLVIVAITFLACNNSSNANASNADPKAPTKVTVQPILTEQGIAPVLLGSNVKDLPQSVEGLYSRRAFVNIDDMDPEEVGLNEVTGWYFYDSKDNLLFTTEDEGNGIIYRIIVHSPTIKTKQGAHVGMSRKQMAAIPGAKLIKPSPEADYEIYSFEIGKISMTLGFDDAQSVIDMSVMDESLIDY